jgi:HlyD family secretion protein/epimerase transport system membrane fusion protein
MSKRPLVPTVPGQTLPVSQSRALVAVAPALTRPRQPDTEEQVAELHGLLRGPARAGGLLIGGFVLGFIGWAALAPLAGGAVASGIVSPDGSRRTVQHLEGGIIATLRVRDGDVVQAGQPLVVLQSIQASATHDALLNQHQTLSLMRARLLAEQAGEPRFTLPAGLTGAGSPGLIPIAAGQQQLFQTRRDSHLARRKVLAQRVQQFQQQIVALDAQVDSTRQQLALIAEELVGKEALRRKEIIAKPEVLRLQRMQAELMGKQGEYIGTIARVQQQIGETEQQALQLEAERADQIATQLDQVRVELAEVTERLNASRDILDRTVVTAPVSGTVVNLRFKTEGGVVQRAEPILDIVPAEEKLLIDARIAPSDIDVVHVGLSAQVHLTAYNSKGMPRIDGLVRSVSADRLADPATNQPYYLARIEVDRAELAQLDAGIRLVPGMPADVLIVTGERTMLAYLFEPFMQAFRRSLRET